MRTSEKTRQAGSNLAQVLGKPAGPFLPWMGGKRRLAPHILPILPAHECYVEAFCGAAAIFFLKPQVKVEVLNDVNSDLVNLYRVLKHHLDEFIRQFRWALASRQVFEWTQDTPPETLTDIQRAGRFYYLQKLCFGGKSTGQTFGTATTSPPRLNLLRMEEELSAVHLRLHQVWIESLDWADCVTRYDRAHTLFYLDPPYFGTAGYGVDFELAQYARMAELLGSIKGKAVVSVNDIPEMRAAFKGLPMRSVGIKYTVGKPGLARREVAELVVANFKF